MHKDYLTNIIKFFAVLVCISIIVTTIYTVVYALRIENSCEITKPAKVIGGKIYHSWGPTQYFLSYAGKDKISGDDCVVSKVRVTLSEYERRMYAGGK